MTDDQTMPLPDEAVTLAGRVIHWLTCGQCDYSPDDLTMVTKADREDATKVLAAALPALTAPAARQERESIRQLALSEAARMHYAIAAGALQDFADLLGGTADGAHPTGGAT